MERAAMKLYRLCGIATSLQLTTVTQRLLVKASFTLPALASRIHVRIRASSLFDSPLVILQVFCILMSEPVCFTDVLTPF